MAALLSLQAEIDRILDNTNFGDRVECEHACQKIEALYSQLNWMPYAFQQILKGKNHLPASKIRPSIFKRNGGFLGQGSYRQHFFKNYNLGSLIGLFVREKAKYSTIMLNLQKKGLFSS